VRKPDDHLRIAFAGGGTGGHIFPALALAREFERHDPRAEIVFFGTRRGLDTKLIPGHGYQLHLIEVEALKGRGMKGILRSLAKLPGAIVSSLRKLRALRPQLVVGLGGYSSGPVLLAAYFLRIPTVLVEPNSIPGLSNRLLGHVAKRIFIAFSRTRDFFPEKSVRLTGNPLRPEVIPGSSPVPTPAWNGFTLLVLGGSQGSKTINAGVLAGMPEVAREIPHFRVIHQTGAADRAGVEQSYRETGVPAVVLDFIEDMGRVYSQADLVIARAGATTLAELLAWGKPAILVPYPFAADQHQRENSRELVEKGAALIFEDRELSGPQLARAVLELYRDEKRREKMGQIARELAHPEAREEIVNQCVELIRN